jgi:hypothetical protein
VSAVVLLFPDRHRLTAAEAEAHWSERAAAARKAAVLLQRQLDQAVAEVARCEALARLAAAKDPACPEPRSSETPGSPTQTEGDPREPA